MRVCVRLCVSQLVRACVRACVRAMLVHNLSAWRSGVLKAGPGFTS